MNRFEQVCCLIEYTVRNLVDCPQSVTVDMIEQEEWILFRLVVAQNDMEKVIGKRGCTARSIRTVLSAISSKVNQNLCWISREWRMTLDREAQRNWYRCRQGLNEADFANSFAIIPSVSIACSRLTKALLTGPARLWYDIFVYP
jgi:uncharacterized protein